MTQNPMSGMLHCRDYVTSKLDLHNKTRQASIGVVLGSGLTHFAEALKHSPEAGILPYAEIPQFCTSTVDGHAGEMIYGTTTNGVPLLALSGRLHCYEGYSPQSVVLPIRILKLLGIQTLILTNASGAMGDNFEPGELMAISDHLNLTGQSPLVGKNIAELGPRFVDMSQAYDKELIVVARQAAKTVGITFHEGIYAGVLGPAYETPAEIRMYKALGAHAVGMSTVFETIAARHMNMRVLAISCLSNKAAGLSAQKISHKEVIEISARVAPKVRQMLELIIDQIS